MGKLVWDRGEIALSNPFLNLAYFFRIIPLKGQCHEIFDFRFSTWISFPQAPDYTNRAILNFLENSWRYS